MGTWVHVPGTRARVDALLLAENYMHDVHRHFAYTFSYIQGQLPLLLHPTELMWDS